MFHLFAAVRVSQGFSFNESQTGCFCQENFQGLKDSTLHKFKRSHSMGIGQLICELIHEALCLGTVKDGRTGFIYDLSGKFLEFIEQLNFFAMRLTDLLQESLIPEEISHNLFGLILDQLRQLCRLLLRILLLYGSSSFLFCLLL